MPPERPSPSGSIACLDVDAGRVVKGVNFRELRDAGDPVEMAKRLRRGGRRRADLPRHHGDQRRPRDDLRRGPPHRRAGLHPADRRRGSAHRRGRGPAAARRRGQGRGQHRCGRASGAGRPRSRTASAPRCWCSRWTPAAAGRARRLRLRGHHARGPDADRHRRHRVGAPRRPSSAPARSCSTRWTPTAPSTAMTSS